MLVNAGTDANPDSRTVAYRASAVWGRHKVHHGLNDMNQCLAPLLAGGCHEEALHSHPASDISFPAKEGSLLRNPDTFNRSVQYSRRCVWT